MESLSEEFLAEIYAAIKKDADFRRLTAAQSGSYHDNRASQIEDHVKWYKLGREGTIPKEWESYIIQIQQSKDPEYQKYLELKNKFKNS